jgi:hypothetical protein
MSLFFFFFSYTKLEKGRWNRSCLGLLVSVQREKRCGNGQREWIWYKYCVHMYVNGKVISVETILGGGGDEGE